jgi:uncharacterized damage-inducible protein DinB
MTQAQLLAAIFDGSRQMSLQTFDKIKHLDIYKEFQVEDKKLNSAYWILGHLPVTENYLLLRSTGGEIEKFGWAKPFGLGGAMPEANDRVSVEEIMKTMDVVHQKAMKHISSLTDEQLAQPNTGGMKFGDGSVRDIIIHAIKHEASHAGHLGWVSKLLGVKGI